MDAGPWLKDGFCSPSFYHPVRSVSLSLCWMFIAMRLLIAVEVSLIKQSNSCLLLFRPERSQTPPPPCCEVEQITTKVTKRRNESVGEGGGGDGVDLDATLSGQTHS